MICCKKILFICLLIFLPGFLPAQEIISSSVQKVDYRIPYLRAEGKTYVFGNQLLREMAKDVLREPWLVRVLISGELGLSVIKANDHHQLLISLRNIALRGDTLYRHFPVTDVLVPSRISMKLRWANRADTSGYIEETLSGKPIPRADSFLCSIPTAPFNPMTDTLMVREVELFYDSLALQYFLERIELIHDYYASLALLDSLQHFTADLHLDNGSLLPINYLKVEELSGVIHRIHSRDFPEKLLRNGFDPSGLMVKYTQMYKHSRSLVYNFMDELHKTGAIPWDRDVDRLAGYFTTRVFSYVRRSYLMDLQQGRIYNDCLDHFFEHEAFPPEDNVAATMLIKMFPAAGQDTIARYISRAVYLSYRNHAHQLMDQHQYAEAYSMMENGRRFIAGNKSLQGMAWEDDLQARAAEGIYNSYVGIASSCITSHKYGMAETYLAKADDYALGHAGYIKSDSGYRAVFSELFFLRNADCDQLLEQKKFDEALDCYRQFEKSYSARDLALVSAQLDEKKSLARAGMGNLSAMLTEDALRRKSSDSALFYYQQATALRQDARIREPVDSRLDSLAPAMAKIKYEQIFREGALALEKRQFTFAVSRLKAAKSLADSNGIDRGREFDSLYRQAMKNYLIVQLSASRKKIWANQFDSAQAALQRTEAAGFDYGLLTDNDFSSALDKFRVKMVEQQCRNLRDSVDLRMIRADRNVVLKNFTNAERYLNDALNLINSDTVCHIDRKALADSLDKYVRPSDYQRNENNVNAMIAVGDYSGAANLLTENNDLFKSGKLSWFGLKQVDIYEFTAGRNNPYLTENMAVYLNKTGQPREAYRFLMLLKDQGMDAKQVNTLQENLGLALAKADLAVNPNENTIAALLKYSAESEWFHVFREAYSKGRERRK